MLGEARGVFLLDPGVPTLEGGVQFGSFLWTGVLGVLTDDDAGEDGLDEDIFPRMLAKDEDSPGVWDDGAGGTLVTGAGDSFLGVFLTLTGLLAWNMFGHLGSAASLLWSERGDTAEEGATDSSETLVLAFLSLGVVFLGGLALDFACCLGFSSHSSSSKSSLTSTATSKSSSSSELSTTRFFLFLVLLFSLVGEGWI